MITTVAKCDGPECHIQQDVPNTEEWPSTWIVVDLIQARDGLTVRAGQGARYGFHSRSCLVVWAAGDTRYRHWTTGEQEER